MAGAQRHRGCRAGKIYFVNAILSKLCCLLECVDFVCGEGLELVDGHADGFFLVGCHIAEVGHKLVHSSFLAQVFEAECLYLLCRRSLESLYFGLKRIYLV